MFAFLCFQCSKEIRLHSIQSIRFPVFKILICFMKPKDLCSPERSYNNTERIEVPVTAEMVKHAISRGQPLSIKIS
jgi:hypothetical protein